MQAMNGQPNRPAQPSSNNTTCPQLFSLGKIVATRGILAHLDQHSVNVRPFLLRHAQGDWGLVPAEDAEANQFAIENGLRILSAYDIAGERVWIITEADRSVTTLLLPQEY